MQLNYVSGLIDSIHGLFNAPFKWGDEQRTELILQQNARLHFPAPKRQVDNMNSPFSVEPRFGCTDGANARRYFDPELRVADSQGTFCPIDSVLN